MLELPVRITTCNAAWGKVPGATGFQIYVNGKYVTTAGPKATAARIGLSEGENQIQVDALGVGEEVLASGKITMVGD